MKTLLGFLLIATCLSLHAEAAANIYIELRFEVRGILSDGRIIAIRDGDGVISSSGGDTEWQEMVPKRGQVFMVTGHPAAAKAAEGDILSGVLVQDGIAKSKSGQIIRNYKFLRVE